MSALQDALKTLEDLDNQLNKHNMAPSNILDELSTFVFTGLDDVISGVEEGLDEIERLETENEELKSQVSDLEGQIKELEGQE